MKCFVSDGLLTHVNEEMWVHLLEGRTGNPAAEVNMLRSGFEEVVLLSAVCQREGSSIITMQINLVVDSPVILRTFNYYLTLFLFLSYFAPFAFCLGILIQIYFF